MKSLPYTLLVMSFIFLNAMAQKAGNSIKYDDIDDYIMVPHQQSLNPGNENWTVCMWIKAPDKSQRGPLLGKRHEASDFNQYTIGIGNTDPHNPTSGRRIYVNYIDTAGISERSGYTQDEFINGTWQHIAFVADKNKDSIFFYIDGVKQTTLISYNYGKWPGVGRLDSLYMGCNSYRSAFYEGEMDEVSIWNKALTPEQINIVMNDTLGSAYYSTTDSGLVAYYRFDGYEDLGIGSDGSDDIRDFSYFCNHGDSEGNPLLIPSGIMVTVENPSLMFCDFILEQNYPNPFNPSTKIKYTIPTALFNPSPYQGEGNRERSVTLKVYDVLGNEVAMLVDEFKPAGSYEVEFRPESSIRQLASGIYFYQLKADNFIETKKMILIK